MRHRGKKSELQAQSFNGGQRSRDILGAESALRLDGAETLVAESELLLDAGQASLQWQEFYSG